MVSMDRLGRIALAASAAGLIGLGAAPGYGQTELEFPGDPVAGRHIFVDRGCVRCHSIWGNGGSLGPDFALVGAGRSLQQLAGMFWNHTPKMIETVSRKGFQWPTFTEEELADIISYIYYVKLFDEPGDPEMGERWFREKRCVECHSVGGRGGHVGPALDKYARYVAPIALAQGMWNKGPTMRAAQAARGVPMPTFVGREIADIQAFIRRNSKLRGRQVVFLEPPDPNKGKRLFTAKQCVRCHGRDGSGTAFGPNLKTATQRLRVAEIAGELWNHSFKMTEAMRRRGITFPRFQGNEMADVIAFLYYLRFYDTGGDPRAGEKVFVRKGCANCHRGDGRPRIGPDLSKSRAALSPLSLATAMWNHAPAMYARSKMEKVEWPRFEDDEMRDLALYLKSLARPAAAAGVAGGKVAKEGSDSGR